MQEMLAHPNIWIGTPPIHCSSEMNMIKPVAALLLLVATPALASELPPDLAQALQAFDRAHFRSDIPVLTRLTSENYMILNSNISLENKAQFLADFRLPGFTIAPYSRTDELNRAWRDAAVTAGVVNLSWTQSGERHTRRLRYIDIWRKHNGHWQVTFTQVTRARQ
jgi:hypothetical protein